MELATVRSPGRDRDVLVHRFLRPARPARLLLTVHRMRRDPLVRLVAVMALAAPWGGCNFDPEICGYDLEPGPDFWCSGARTAPPPENGACRKAARRLVAHGYAPWRATAPPASTAATPDSTSRASCRARLTSRLE